MGRYITQPLLKMQYKSNKETVMSYLFTIFSGFYIHIRHLI